MLSAASSRSQQCLAYPTHPYSHVCGVNRIYGYLRASTKDQDALRAKGTLDTFVKDMGQSVSAWFVEHESGATLKRPELFRLLDIAQRGDVLLVEQVDRISRLNAEDWKHLKSQITGKGIIIVALDLPTSHQFMHSKSDEFTQRMLSAINGMMLDMLAAVARKTMKTDAVANWKALIKQE